MKSLSKKTAGKAPDSKKAIVVGAGPGGLAIAMLLAKEGVEVTLFEKDRRVGGRTKTLDDGGFRFDMGPTFFLYPQILESIFARCGLAMSDYVALRRVDPSYRIAFENGPDVHVSGDIDQLEREISKIDADDARQIRRFIDVNRRKLADFTPVLTRSFTSMLDYLAPPVLKAFRHVVPLSSVDQELRRFFKDPRVRLVFSFQTKYLGMSPFRCPNLFTFLSFLEYEFGVWHPVGGCGAVSDAMAQAARDLGVDIRLGEAVEAIEFDARRATGVHTVNGVSAADAVVVNADFAHAVTHLIPSRLRKKWSDKNVASMKYSCSTFMLYLGIEGQYDVDHHNIFLSHNYERNIADIESANVIPSEPSIYVANPGRTDPAFAQNGMSSLYVLVPVGHCGTIDWSTEKQSFRNTVLDRLDSLGFKGLRQRIRYEKLLTPDDWRDQSSIYLGATFNLAHGLDQMLYFRPHNRLQDVEGVYLVGGGTHPGSGLPVIYEGARISADLVLDDLGLASARGNAGQPSAMMSEPSLAIGRGSEAALSIFYRPAASTAIEDESGT
jgi:phytoene desaturase